MKIYVVWYLIAIHFFYFYNVNLSAHRIRLLILQIITFYLHCIKIANGYKDDMNRKPSLETADKLIIKRNARSNHLAKDISIKILIWPRFISSIF